MRVPALFAFVGAVAGEGLVDVEVAEVDAFDLALREVARGVGDLEAAFARAVDQVGRGVGQVLHVGVLPVGSITRGVPT